MSTENHETGITKKQDLKTRSCFLKGLFNKMILCAADAGKKENVVEHEGIAYRLIRLWINSTAHLAAQLSSSPQKPCSAPSISISFAFAKVSDARFE